MGLKMNETKLLILNEIESVGYFLYKPELWSKLFSHAIHELVLENRIETLSSAGIEFMNGSYYYIPKGNPRKVNIITDGTFSYIKPTF